jgi:hypothetical protein
MEKRANLDRVPFSRFFFLSSLPHLSRATQLSGNDYTSPSNISSPMGLHTKLQRRPLYIFLGSLLALSFFIFIFISTPELTCPPTFLGGGGGYVTAVPPSTPGAYLSILQGNMYSRS